MATAAKTAETDTKVTSAKWGNEEVQVLAGFELVDKSTMIDKPFLITGARMIMTKGGNNSNPVEMMQVECEVDPRTHKKVVFQDSSGTGVKTEIEDLLKLVHAWKGDLDVWYDFRYLCPGGLRVSNYEAVINGKTIKGTTYYLTKAGNGRA